MAFDLDTMVCCDWLCIVGVCVSFAICVDDWFLHLMFGYFVISYVKVVCVCVLPLLFIICVWI